ncbi:MAG: pentapeptide repeat-containing protein [Methylophilales bacterium]|nr:pentapeptide repeat-containing protein [Methylophilales bacterium]
MRITLPFFVLLVLFSTHNMAAEADKNCAFGMAMGAEVPTDCSVNEVVDGKKLCFSSEESKSMFLANKNENMMKMQDFQKKMAPVDTEAMKEKISTEQARTMLKEASANNIVDFSGKDLSYQDLSHMDLRYAKFVDTNLFGSDLRGSDFTGADMRQAYLNLARIEGTIFNEANLTDAIIFQPIFEKNQFKNTILVNARMIGTLGTVDMSGADIRKGRFGLDIGNQPMGAMRFESAGGKFVGTNFEGADINRSKLQFCDLTGANLRNTNLFRADFSKADLTGADLTGADLGEAVFDGTIMKDVKGLESVKGWDTIKGKCEGCK